VPNSRNPAKYLRRVNSSSASSRVMVFVSVPNLYSSAGSGAVHNYSNARLVRDSTNLYTSSFGTYNYASSNNPDFYTNLSTSYVDSPATTSAVTYKLQANTGSSTLVAIQASSVIIASIVVMEIGA